MATQFLPSETPADQPPSFEAALEAYHRARADQSRFYLRTMEPALEAHEACPGDTAEAKAALAVVWKAEETFAGYVDATEKAARSLFATPSRNHHDLAFKLHLALIESLFEEAQGGVLFDLLQDVRALGDRYVPVTMSGRA